MSISNIQYDVKPFDENTNMFSWKGQFTKGLIIAGSVYIWIMPNNPEVLPFFAQDFDFEEKHYKEHLRNYEQAMNRPPDAAQMMMRTFEWPAICLNTLEEHLDSFSQDFCFPIDETHLSFRFLKGEKKEIERHFQRKFRSQHEPPSDYIKKLLSITLSSQSSNIFEEVTDEVVFFFIQDKEKTYQELCEVKEIVKSQKNIIHHAYQD